MARSSRLPRIALLATVVCTAGTLTAVSLTAGTRAAGTRAAGTATAGTTAASPPVSAAPSASASQTRMTVDVAAGRPIVVHVVVALCDNEHQGIVPVPKSLGQGRNPASNLYWGARYGVRTFLAREAGWKPREVARPADARILERA